MMARSSLAVGSGAPGDNAIQDPTAPGRGQPMTEGREDSFITRCRIRALGRIHRNRNPDLLLRARR